MLFAWGMQKQGQLGIGDMNTPFSTPRPISYLQDVIIYNVNMLSLLTINMIQMACGAYHSMVVLGDATKQFKKDMIITRLTKRVDNNWNAFIVEAKENYDPNLVLHENMNPSDEGKIDNPKAMKKTIN